MPEATEHVLEYRVRIAASAEIVFRHFTDPELLTRWLGRRAVLDPRPGGRWSVDVNGLDVAAGTYVEVEPYSRLSFTWGWTKEPHEAPIESLVEIDLREEGELTVVHLRHSGLPPELRESHDRGWQHYLDRLAVAAPGGDPGPDPLGTVETRHGASSVNAPPPA